MRRNSRGKDTNQENEGAEPFPISNHALQYAVEHHLPPIRIECNPKLDDQSKGKEIVKALFNHIEKDFRCKNAWYAHPIAFDYWYIDKYGKLACYTRHTELYVYLCDPRNYPSSAANVEIVPLQPNHLPVQHSLILKFIPNCITEEELKMELGTHVNSLFKVEEMRGSKTDKYRHVRMEIKSTAEYEQMLTMGEIAIDGQMIEIGEFLAPPRLLICSKCNDPGHVRKYCTFKYEACRRCGEDRSTGEHKECAIKCHRCQFSHLSTDYKCPFLIEYRRTLLRKLKENPNLLPANTRIFIPFDCRDKGHTRNRFLTNPAERKEIVRAKNGEYLPAGNNESHGWPSLVTEPCRWNTEGNQTNESNVWQDLKNKQNEIEQMKEALAGRLKEHRDQYNEHMNKIHMILMSISHLLKSQNDDIQQCHSTTNEILPILTSTLTIIQQIAENNTNPSKSKEENGETQKLQQHTWLALKCLKDGSEIRAATQRKIDDAMGELMKMLNEGINNIRTTNEQ